jgi:metal-responsive CopG/Arc/MetJ family transcriptional regulator
MARKLKVSVALSADLVKRLDRVARASGDSRSQLITDLVEGGLEQAETMIKVTSDRVMMGAIGRVMADPGVLRNMVNGLRSELSDEQLALFKSRLDAVTGVLNEIPKARRMPKLKG